MLWPIVPLCKNQLKDIHSEDILENGLYRFCNIYKGGGGYDKFNSIYFKRFHKNLNNKQFIVQLYGCPLNCDYCYITKDGIFGNPIFKETKDILNSYYKTNVDVFHLMGGAPALYLKYWKEFDTRVKVFHSDFLLIEGKYKKEYLIGLRGLHAVSLKDFKIDESLMLKNLDLLIECGINFYITFTGYPLYKELLIKRYGNKILEDSFEIKINKNYKSLQNIYNELIE